jgi:hypothetical protein
MILHVRRYVRDLASDKETVKSVVAMRIVLNKAQTPFI